MTTPTAPITPTTGSRGADTRLQAKILATINKKSFGTLATVSPSGYPHVAGVVYEAVGSTLWAHTTRSSRKGRSLAASSNAAFCVPFRRLPVGPPYTIHFQARAELVAMDDPQVREMLSAGQLKSLTGHGELDMADGCFVKIQPAGAIHSFGPGAKVLDLIRDPIAAGGRHFYPVVTKS